MVVNSSQIERRISFLEKKWDFRVFLVWDLFDGHETWIDGLYHNSLCIQHSFLQLFNSIKADNLKFSQLLRQILSENWSFILEIQIPAYLIIRSN